MRVLIVDGETTGLNWRKDLLIEAGAILYSVRQRAILQQWSSLLYARTNPVVEKINNISQAALDEMKDVETTHETLWRMARSADALVAYNKDFDRGFFEAFTKDVLVDGLPFPPLPWICAMRDIRYPKRGVDRKLTTVAEAHDIALGGEHRGLFDCLLVAQLFTVTPDLEQQLQHLGVKRENTLVKSFDNVARP